MESKELRLDLLTVAYGPEGIVRVATHSHPALPGVRYIVCWQNSGDTPIPESLVKRSDFEIYRYNDFGVSKNRNHSLEHFEAPIGMLSDDDVDYTAEELEGVLRCFEERPDVDLLFFKYHSKYYPKKYFDFEFDFRNAPKYFYYTNFEMAFRHDSIKNKVWFDERFGINSGVFIAGEEDMFVLCALKQGLVLHFVPQFNSRHDGSTTCEREGESDEMIKLRGAVVAAYHPWMCWPRFILYSFRRQDRSRGFFKYMGLLLKGVYKEWQTRK